MWREVLGLSNKLLELRERIWTPPKDLKSWEWCRDNVESIPYSPVPGGFNPDITPVIKPVMEAIQDIRNNLVVLCFSVQSCKSLSIELSIMDWIKNDPAPTMLVLPTSSEAANVMKSRLKPLMNSTPLVKELIPSGKDRDLATMSYIQFNNSMSFWCMGAATNNLQGRTVRRVLIDECWMLEPTKIEEAMARNTRFDFLSKTVLASQGSDPDHDFKRFWDKTNQSDWCFTCDECGLVQPFDFFKNVDFNNDLKTEDGEYLYDEIAESATLICQNEACNRVWEDTDDNRRDLNESASFVAAVPHAPKGQVGLRVNAVAFQSWGKLVVEFLQAKRASWVGDYGPIRTFHQKRLASLTFGDGIEDTDFKIETTGDGYKAKDYLKWRHSEEWDEANVRYSKPHQRFLFSQGRLEQGWIPCVALTVDVQQDCFYYGVRSFQVDGKSRLIDAGKVASWDELEFIRQKYTIHPNFVFVDNGHNPTVNVYPYISKYNYRCLRGDQKSSYPHRVKTKGGYSRIDRLYSAVKTSSFTTKDKAVNYHFFSATECRNMLQRLMQLEDRWQLPDDLKEFCPEYYEHLSSQRKVKKKSGYIAWERIGKRPDHLSDVETMQVVFGLMLKILGNETESTNIEEAA